MAINNQQGFTLIELLIVIVIISIVSSVAVLTVHNNQNKRLQAMAEQLANVLQLAEEEALLRPATLGFKLTKTSFQFYLYHENGKHPWQPMNDRIYGLHHIPDDVEIKFKTDEEIPENTPQLIISGGSITPFTLLIGKKDEPARYKIVGASNGTIKTGIVNNDEN